MVLCDSQSCRTFVNTYWFLTVLPFFIPLGSYMIAWSAYTFYRHSHYTANICLQQYRFRPPSYIAMHFSTSAFLLGLSEQTSIYSYHNNILLRDIDNCKRKPWGSQDIYSINVKYTQGEGSNRPWSFWVYWQIQTHLLFGPLEWYQLEMKQDVWWKLKFEDVL